MFGGKKDIRLLTIDELRELIRRADNQWESLWNAKGMDAQGVLDLMQAADDAGWVNVMAFVSEEPESARRAQEAALASAKNRWDRRAAEPVEKKCAKLEKQRDAARTTIDRCAQILRDHGARIAIRGGLGLPYELSSEVGTLIHERDALTRECDGLRKIVDAYQKQLADVRGEERHLRDALREELTKAKTERAEFRESYEMVRDDHLKMHKELAEAHDALATLQAAYDRLGKESEETATAALRERDEALHERDEARAELARMEAESQEGFDLLAQLERDSKED